MESQGVYSFILVYFVQQYVCEIHHLATCSKSHSFSLLYSIPFKTHTTISLSILSLMEVWVVSIMAIIKNVTINILIHV